MLLLGAVGDEQILDGLSVEESKRYLHHYNFPPYSVGEAKPMRGPGRREIGHGALAERALVPVNPTEDEFLADKARIRGAGVQWFQQPGQYMRKHVGAHGRRCPDQETHQQVAMGLVKYGDDFTILTDIQGLEDALGDMDFKVAGTVDGITAIQMDIKIDGLSKQILSQALEQAR